MADDELPKPEEIEVEFQDLYRHDEEQAYLTLMSQEIKSINFPCEENYTIRLCKELVSYHNPETHPLGSFELLASNRIRSDEETLGEIFNGTPYYTDKEPAEDPDFDWVPRKEQVFSDKQLMQLSIWKKEWDDETKEYDPVDLSYSPYGYHETRKWKKLGYLDENNKLKDEGVLIAEGKITDQEMIDKYYKKQATIKTLREDYAIREKHAKEVANELKESDSVDEAIEWLKFHKEKDWNEAMKKKERMDAGETVQVEKEVNTEDENQDDED